MAPLMPELVISNHILFSLYLVHVTFNLFKLCFLCYSQVARDGRPGDCSFYFSFVVYIDIEKKKEMRVLEMFRSVTNSISWACMFAIISH